MKTVSVIGLGYIGLPTAIFSANAGYSVRGVDINPEVIESVNSAILHIVEPGLEQLLQKAVANKNLSANLELISSDVYLICVPTPFKGRNKSPDLSFVFDAVSKISKVLRAGDLIILESTSPVGTSDQIQKYLLDQGHSESDFSIAYCPERVLPGNIIEEFQTNDRIIGEVDNRAYELAASFYEKFTVSALHKTTAKCAELCKLVENSYRDVNIAFANELSLICNEDDIDVWETIKLANLHPRVNILKPGAGVGGHCISVDPWFLVDSYPQNSRLIKTARKVNEHKPNWVIRNIEKHVIDYQKHYRCSPVVSIYGLSFKPNIDDLRESPALQVALEISEREYTTLFVEPHIEEFSSLKISSLDEALEKGDIHVFLVAHGAFTASDVKERLNRQMVLDYCGCFK